MSASSAIIPPQPLSQGTVSVSQPNVQPSIPQAPVAVHKNNELVSKNTILDLKNLSIPILDADTKFRMRLFCPQIRKTVIEMAFDEQNIDSYLHLSKHIINTLSL